MPLKTRVTDSSKIIEPSSPLNNALVVRLYMGYKTRFGRKIIYFSFEANKLIKTMLTF